MFELPALLRLAGALAEHAAARHAAVARNVAHADTPGYRAERLPPFARLLEGGGGTPGRMALAVAAPVPWGADRAWGRGALPAAEEAAPNGNRVSLEAELVEAAAARHEHALALAIWRSGASVLRSTLAR